MPPFRPLAPRAEFSQRENFHPSKENLKDAVWRIERAIYRLQAGDGQSRNAVFTFRRATVG